MSAVLTPSDAADELVSNEPFFAPTSTDLVDGLLAQYDAMRAKVDTVAALFEGDIGSVVHYFIEGNRAGDGSRYSSLSAEKIFRRDGAVAALNAAYWEKALALTDVFDYMPQARRNEWHTMIREHAAPDFTAEAVRPTLLELLNSRSKFFAERVDGIFRGLSGHHVTNAPEAFGKRMIIAHVLTCYDTTDHERVGLIDDLRCVIAKFMGREEVRYGASLNLVKVAKHRRGEWVTTDGGALRIKVFKVGTAHLEVHPDMAWRLNAVLAQLHPLAIPAAFRQKPRRPRKDFPAMQRPLPHRVLAILAESKVARRKIESAWPERYEAVQRTVTLKTWDVDKAALAEARAVLEAIGGVVASGTNGTWYEFDYEAIDVIHEIVVSGVMPDQQSHQFYPTPDGLARRVIELADIGDADTCLEPSAGQGALVELLPAGRTTAVELSGLHCGILRAKFGQAVDVIQGDFVLQADDWWMQGKRFDRVLMNPPFADGRAKLHATYASHVVAPGGLLVAILPGSLRGKELLGSDFDHEWHGPFEDEFAGTSVAVCILVATRRAA